MVLSGCKPALTEGDLVEAVPEYAHLSGEWDLTNMVQGIIVMAAGNGCSVRVTEGIIVDDGCRSTVKYPESEHNIASFESYRVRLISSYTCELWF